MNKKRRQRLFPALLRPLPLAGLLLLAGCLSQTKDLQLTDLTSSEHLYCERIITLERAKTVALIHRDTGEVLLDSLAVAWGDSVKPETLAGLSTDPRRAVAVGELLSRLLSAEQDSLRWDPGSSRLHLPLPDLNRPGREQSTVPDTNPSGAIPRT